MFNKKEKCRFYIRDILNRRRKRASFSKARATRGKLFLNFPSQSSTSPCIESVQQRNTRVEDQ